MTKYFFTIIAALIVLVSIISFIKGNVEGEPVFGNNCEGCHVSGVDKSQEITSNAGQPVSLIESVSAIERVSAAEHVSDTQRQTEMVAKMESQMLMLKELNKQILDLKAIYEAAKEEGATKTAERVEALIVQKQQTFQDNLDKVRKILSSQTLLFNDDLYKFRIY